jgi:hypothetical protein
MWHCRSEGYYADSIATVQPDPTTLVVDLYLHRLRIEVGVHSRMKPSLYYIFVGWYSTADS